ncbi:hypothetical protein [Polyangium sp. 15x6]|uniref:hypothetical protein n=1 Tax=Polyangium sp. 15x6 TaxID=3042687 RepID=UPI00249B31EC|nr:hypothetical protein [Polyangium sp. 15x6]MDI3281929.1 hypothetical protein [Polyangium sp. 15x6]
MLSRFAASGAIITSYLDAFKAFPDAPQAVFAKYGLGRVGPSGEFEILPACPLDKVIAAMNELFTVIGPQKGFEMGAQVVNHAAVPPGATSDIVTALQTFDAGYHLNHLEDGVPMFDPQTGTMRDGIGHYKCVSSSRHRAVMEVDSPYNCDLDRGIIQAWARRFERTALITHLEPTVCRKTRAPRCRYEVSWK